MQFIISMRAVRSAHLTFLYLNTLAKLSEK